MASLPTVDEMRSAYPALAHYETDDENAASMLGEYFLEKRYI